MTERIPRRSGCPEFSGGRDHTPKQLILRRDRLWTLISRPWAGPDVRSMIPTSHLILSCRGILLVSECFFIIFFSINKILHYWLLCAVSLFHSSFFNIVYHFCNNVRFLKSSRLQIRGARILVLVFITSIWQLFLLPKCSRVPSNIGICRSEGIIFLYLLDSKVIGKSSD